MEEQQAIDFSQLLEEASVKRLENNSILARRIREELNFLVQNNRQTYAFPSSLFTRFPGSQPVSFLRKHLNLLLSEDYYVCEKSDGLRLLLFFPEPHKYNRAAFLIDRESNVYEIPECLLYTKKDAGAEDAYHVPAHVYF